MSVKRFDISGEHYEVFGDNNGEYCLYEDYAALEQRLIESERYGRQTDITIDNLEMKLAQMAAENAGLKSAISNIQGAIELACAGINDDRRGCVFKDILNAVYMKTHSETQNTYAFLAEVRASAIDNLVTIKTKQLADMHPDTHAFGANAMSIRSQINELQVFAAQLRKGVQS
ncbi:hypothetical protein NHG68_15475 [Enterobacter sp. Z1]|uniref:hypothetical protein n=1 Tax=Enterobacter sp. Z1 TaxID=2561927 RepID=UPI001652A257|nr:hypothetical protein [Enterobacter sp. Z1]USX30409.1 hypothetical protein NHG68_15475 [Enterobacter sp. Z1]